DRAVVLLRPRSEGARSQGRDLRRQVAGVPAGGRPCESSISAQEQPPDGWRRRGVAADEGREAFGVDDDAIVQGVRDLHLCPPRRGGRLVGLVVFAPDATLKWDARAAGCRTRGSRVRPRGGGSEMPRRPPHPRRRTIGVLGVAALMWVVARHAEAFFPTNLRTLGGIQGHTHEAITTDSLVTLDAELFSPAQPTHSMRAANDAIVDGNVHVDDDQLHSALHFDGENFVAGQGRLLGIKEIVIASIQQNDTQGARNELGQALHSIQDFYAHSNWTNNNGSVNPDLGVTDHQLQNTLGINDPAEVNGQLTTLLTSGYYHGEDRSPPTSITNGHKDRHGGLTDTLSPIDFGLGLNRDSNNPEFSPEALKHELAANLAQQATMKYIHEILDQLTPKQVALLLGQSRTF